MGGCVDDGLDGLGRVGGWVPVPVPATGPSPSAGAGVGGWGGVGIVVAGGSHLPVKTHVLRHFWSHQTRSPAAVSSL